MRTCGIIQKLAQDSFNKSALCSADHHCEHQLQTECAMLHKQRHLWPLWNLWSQIPYSMAIIWAHSVLFDHMQSNHDIIWNIQAWQLDNILCGWEAVNQNQAAVFFLQLINKAKPIHNHAGPISVCILGKLVVYIFPAHPKACCQVLLMQDIPLSPLELDKLLVEKFVLFLEEVGAAWGTNFLRQIL